MASFATLQDRFQRGLLSGDDDILFDIKDSARETRQVLFGVYRNAYSARLLEIIQRDFERLYAYLGDDAFESAARAYIAAHPSRQPNARWFSQTIPDFLRVTAPWCDAPELAEIADLERALDNAFDAADSVVLTFDRLVTIPASEWSNLRFTPHPSAARLDLRTNAAAIWMALGEEREPPAVVIPGKLERLIVWRQDLTSKFRSLPEDEAMIWDEAAAGAPFGVLCEMLAFRSEAENAPLRAASLLQGWIASGLMSDIR